MVQRSVAVAAAVNDRGVLRNCLLRSPDVVAGRLEVRTYEGAKSASKAYNQALAESDAEIVVFPHQDVYLPAGFLARLLEQLETLDRVDDNWALAGVVGLDAARRVKGRTWSSGLQQLIGDAIDGPAVVETLDEMLLIVRRASGFTFDDQMPSFHLYAADAVQSVKARGLKSYVIDLPAIHHSRPVVCLDAGYQRAYRYMQKKWWGKLPLPNLVCAITRSPFTLPLQDLKLRARSRGKARSSSAQGNPSEIAVRLGFEQRES